MCSRILSNLKNPEKKDLKGILLLVVTLPIILANGKNRKYSSSITAPEKFRNNTVGSEKKFIYFLFSSEFY
jgi:hypothetical protein